jgi:hypothetical protein
MRRSILPLLVLMAWTFGGAALQANVNQPGVSIQCNYDFTNTSGREVFDIEVVLRGPVNPNGFYNVYFNNQNPTQTTDANGNTVLHWVNPTHPILQGTLIHVGFTPIGTNDCPLLAVYWTDANHNRVSSSFIGVAYNHLTGTTQKITNLSLLPISVYDIRMACQDAALPLDALNATNEYLAGAMVPIADATTLQPGQSLEIPVQIPCSQCHCVTNFKTSGEGLDAIFSPWVQEFVE